MARSLERQQWTPVRVPRWSSERWTRVSSRLRTWLLVTSLLVLALGGLHLYRITSVPVTLVVDGQRLVLRTHRTTVAGVLEDAGLRLDPADIVQPTLSATVTPGMEVRVRRARPVQIYADGRTLNVRTQARTVRELLHDAGIYVTPYDEVVVEGQVTPDLDAPLPERDLPSSPLQVAIRRAVPIRVHDNGATYVIHTTASTVGEALQREKVTLYLGDLVRPGLGTPVTAGLRIHIERSVPFSVRVDGREIHTRTRQWTVADALADLGIVVTGADIVTPSLSTEIKPHLSVAITRVREAIEIEQDAIPYRTIWVPDDDLEIDHRRVDQPGQEGLIKRRFRVVYHDGEPVSRVLEDEWIAQEPITRVIAYGRKIVLRTLETPYGPITYWRKIRMLATSYSPSTAGVEPDDPYFGRTRLGWRMRKGIVAVDPTVIKLGSRVYVPGYGIGDAADTGGLIRGRRIDLGFDDHNLELWYRWVDVYLLAPPPPRYQIRWILPDWPRERHR
ncbi:MAG TPA: DUF348 domain-containing protein [Caldilineae bacterium]|nr:DUF348 domain-containing protein [Caldilineae bacterium]